MIEENAIVVALEGDDALVQTQRRSACHSCSVKRGCGTSVLSQVVGQRSSQIRVQNTLQAKLGDEVVLGIRENALVQGSLLVYALPLIMLLVFGLLGEFWARSVAIDNELISILAGITGFILAMFIIRHGFSRSRLKQNIQPQMLRIVHTVSGARDTILTP